MSSTGCVTHRLTSLVAAVLMGAMPSRQEPPSASEVLELASSRFARTASVCADFEQHLDVVLLGEERRGKGRLCQMSPDSFGMRFTDPPGDLVLADGTWVWIYYPSMEAGQVVRLATGGQRSAHNIFDDFLREPTTRYDASYLGGEDLEDVGRMHRVRVVPRERAAFAWAELWIGTEDHLLHKVRVEDENGSIRTVLLTSMVVEPAGLDESWFEFTPPPGTTIIAR